MKVPGKLFKSPSSTMPHYQKLRFSFDIYSKEILDYLYQRINYLDADRRDGDAQSLSDEFHEIVDKAWDCK
jgi:hypothetical protein